MMNTTTAAPQASPQPPPIPLSSTNLETRFLEVSDAKVGRLKGGSAEVVQGDAVPLVATASFHYLHHLPAATWAANGAGVSVHVTPGETLFYIDEGGEVRSPRLPIDPDAVARFLDANYSFDFTIKTSSGRSAPPLPDSILHKTSVEWVRVLETAGLQSDLVEIDVRVEPTSSVRLELAKPKETCTAIVDSLAQMEQVLRRLPGDVAAAQQAALAALESQIATAITGAEATLQQAITSAITGAEATLQQAITSAITGAEATLQQAITSAITGAESLILGPVSSNEESAKGVPARTAAMMLPEISPAISSTDANVHKLLSSAATVLEKLGKIDQMEQVVAQLAVLREFEWAPMRELLESVQQDLTSKRRPSKADHG